MPEYKGTALSCARQSLDRRNRFYRPGILRCIARFDKKKGPAKRGLPLRTSPGAKGDPQAAAASNCQFLGNMTASIACTMPFAATISALLIRASFTRTSDEDTTTVSGVPCAVAVSPDFRSLAMK